MFSNQKYILIAAMLLSGLGTNAAAAAGKNSGPSIKCWKNDIGIRECGSYVPPEYSQKRIEVLNARGQVIQVIQPPKTPEELEKERLLAIQRKAEEDAKKEQDRQDKILLDSYTTERDLIIARDTNIKASQAQLDITKGNLKFLLNNLDDLQKRAGNFERAGKKPPQKLVDEIENTKKPIEEKKRNVQKMQDEKTAMEQRYARDLARFRKLKGIKSEASEDTTPASATAVPNKQAEKP
jgi:hypothetical protein